MFDGLQIGLSAEEAWIVTEEMTASAWGSGSVQVFSTPAMIALMESTAVAAIDKILPDGFATVGIQIDVRHLAATPVGEEVRAEAEVIDMVGKRVTFSLRAWDDQDVIGEGTHTRYIIDVEKFMERVEKRDRTEE